MSGKRHHYLPQLLLRGFRSRKKGSKGFSFVYKKCEDAFESNIKDIAVEQYFYKCCSHNADDAITKREDIYGNVVDRVRINKMLDKVDLPILLSFVGEMAVRQKGIVKSLNGVFSSTLDKASKEMLNDSVVDRIVDGMADEDFIIEWISKEVCSSLAVSEVEAKRIAKGFVLQNSGFIEERLLKVKAFMNAVGVGIGHSIASNCRSNMYDMIKLGQVKVLEKEFCPSAMECGYEGFSWRLVLYEYDSLILGDVGPFGLSDSGEAFPLIVAEKMTKILFPISTDVLLLGESSDVELELDVKKINQLSASLSSEFFVSHVMSDANVELQKTIGTLGYKYCQG